MNKVSQLSFLMELGSVYIIIPLHQQRARHRADNHGGRQDSHYTEKLILQWTFSEHFNLKVNLLYTCGLTGWGGKAIRQAPWASGDGCLRDSSQGPEAPPSLPTVEALCGFSTGCLQFTQDGSPTAVGEDAKELLACFPEIVCSS